MTNCVIYDFETLGQDVTSCPVLSFAVLDFDEDKFISDVPYDYKELVDRSFYIKFNVKDQLRRYKRIIEKDSLLWWEKKSKESRQVLKPSPEDKQIEYLFDFINRQYGGNKIDKTFTRGNAFDPILLQSLMKAIGKYDPFPWWSIRDTRSFIEGMLMGTTDVDNKFIPEGLESDFVAHDPRHDIAMDVMRMQVLTRAIIL